MYLFAYREIYLKNKLPNQIKYSNGVKKSRSVRIILEKKWLEK